MMKPLLGAKVAVLVANGFCEADMIEAQRNLQSLGANVRIVSMDHGLVSSWNGTGWGLNFAADMSLGSSLAADFEMLVIPGGQRSADKLQLTAHTRRFIGGFIDTGKPVVSMSEAASLLAFAQKVEGRTISGATACQACVEEAGGSWSEDSISIDANIMSASVDDENRADIMSSMAGYVADMFKVSQAA